MQRRVRMLDKRIHNPFEVRFLSRCLGTTGRGFFIFKLKVFMANAHTNTSVTAPTSPTATPQSAATQAPVPIKTGYLFAPYIKDPQRRLAAVLMLEVQMVHSWAVYGKYQYVWAASNKLNHIGQFNWDSVRTALEQLDRGHRLVEFVDKSGFRPKATQRTPRSHANIKLLDNPDHLTYWEGPKGEPLVLVEPYTLREAIVEEIEVRGLTAFLLPQPGIYGGAGGKSTSVFLTTPQYAAVFDDLDDFKFDWRSVDPESVRWSEALDMGKLGTISQQAERAALRCDSGVAKGARHAQ